MWVTELYHVGETSSYWGSMSGCPPPVLTSRGLHDAPLEALSLPSGSRGKAPRQRDTTLALEAGAMHVDW